MNMTYTNSCKYQLPCGWCELRMTLCTQNGGITITPYWSDGTSGVVNTAVERKEEQHKMPKEEELKPCPFCDGHASMEIDGSLYCASCDDCGATGARMYGYKDAVEAWNRRASDE